MLKIHRGMLNPHLFKNAELLRMAGLADDLGADMANTYLPTTNITAMIACLTAGSAAPIGTGAAYMGINTASPSTTGANEIIGTGMTTYSTGGYTGTRMSIGWAAFSTDHQSSNTTQTFPLLAVQAGGIPYFSLWTLSGAASLTVYVAGGPTTGLSGSIPSGANVTFASGGVVLTLAD
jgi:hypothetical protein